MTSIKKNQCISVTASVNLDGDRARDGYLHSSATVVQLII